MALIPLFSHILKIPRQMLTILIVIFCFIGSFAINLNPVDLYTMVGFGVLGWGMQKFAFSQASFCIALILGPMTESNLRRGLLQTGDNLLAFLFQDRSPRFSWLWPSCRSPGHIMSKPANAAVYAQNAWNANDRISFHNRES